MSVDLNKMSKRQLSDILAGMDMKKSGTKAELIHRIVDTVTLDRIQQYGGETNDESYFVDISELPSRKQAKYCRCILHVAADEDPKCLRRQNWGRDQPCVNPYAVCTSSVGRDSLYCTRYYDFDGIPENEYQALLALKDKTPSQLRAEWRKERRNAGLSDNR